MGGLYGRHSLEESAATEDCADDVQGGADQDDDGLCPGFMLAQTQNGLHDACAGGGNLRKGKCQQINDRSCKKTSHIPLLASVTSASRSDSKKMATWTKGYSRHRNPVRVWGCFFIRITTFNFPFSTFCLIYFTTFPWGLSRLCGLCTRSVGKMSNYAQNCLTFAFADSTINGGLVLAVPRSGVARRALLFRSGPAPGTNPILKDSVGVFEGIWNGIFGRSSSSLLLLSSF